MLGYLPNKRIVSLTLRIRGDVPCESNTRRESAALGSAFPDVKVWHYTYISMESPVVKPPKTTSFPPKKGNKKKSSPFATDDCFFTQTSFPDGT